MLPHFSFSLHCLSTLSQKIGLGTHWLGSSWDVKPQLNQSVSQPECPLSSQGFVSLSKHTPQDDTIYTHTPISDRYAGAVVCQNIWGMPHFPSPLSFLSPLFPLPPLRSRPLKYR